MGIMSNRAGETQPATEHDLADTRTPAQRRHIMQSVKQADTGPEMIVRRLLHGMGYRYRLHRKDLPGRPDIVFGGRRKVVFVHGCFWHGHGCDKGQLPKSRLDYWAPKIEANMARDQKARRALEDDRWRVLEVWQCEIGDTRTLADRLVRFLES